jgi:hypothetical protein
MQKILELQARGTDEQARVWSTWSLVGCASTLSLAVC